jgi:hypothetical protein
VNVCSYNSSTSITRTFCSFHVYLQSYLIHYSFRLNIRYIVYMNNIFIIIFFCRFLYFATRDNLFGAQTKFRGKGQPIYVCFCKLYNIFKIFSFSFRLATFRTIKYTYLWIRVYFQTNFSREDRLQIE